MVRFLTVFALAIVPTTVSAGSIDSVNATTEVSSGKRYLKVYGKFTTSAAGYMVQVRIKCPAKPALDEGPLAANVTGKPDYIRLSDKEVDAQTYEVSVTLVEDNVEGTPVKKTFKVTTDGTTWMVAEVKVD